MDTPVRPRPVHAGSALEHSLPYLPYLPHPPYLPYLPYPPHLPFVLHRHHIELLVMQLNVCSHGYLAAE